MRPLALTLAAALVLTACRAAPTGSVAYDGERLASTACGPVERPPLQGGSHLIGDAAPPVPYSSVPPTSGWHASGAVPTTADAPLTDPQIVSVLETGNVVAAVAADAELGPGVAAALAAAFPKRLVVTTYDTAMTTDVALVAWGLVVRCEAFDADAVSEFVLRYAGRSSGH